MSFRFRKSLSLGKGAKFNIGKRSLSVSFGGRGIGFTTGTAGTTVSASAPGTGLGYRKKLGANQTRDSQTSDARSSGRRARREKQVQAEEQTARESPHPVASFIVGLSAIVAIAWGAYAYFNSPRGPRPVEPTPDRAAAHVPGADPAASTTVATTIGLAPQLSPEEKTRKRFVAKLKQARIYIRTNLLEPAEKNLREIIREAPGTTVAAEAQKELDAMPAH